LKLFDSDVALDGVAADNQSHDDIRTDNEQPADDKQTCVANSRAEMLEKLLKSFSDVGQVCK
jgi:hypothetical protein